MTAAAAMASMSVDRLQRSLRPAREGMATPLPVADRAWSASPQGVSTAVPTPPLTTAGLENLAHMVHPASSLTPGTCSKEKCSNSLRRLVLVTRLAGWTTYFILYV